MEFTRSLGVSLLCVMAAGSSLASAQDQSPTPTDSSVAAIATRQSLKDSTAKSVRSALILVTSEAVDRLRTNQLLTGVAKGESLLLRSASSLMLAGALSAGGWRFAPLAPQFLL